MRIISKFKDYYDGLQDPTDKDLTYVRHSEFLPYDHPHAVLDLGKPFSFSSVRPINGEPIFPAPTPEQLKTPYGMTMSAKYSRHRNSRLGEDPTYIHIPILFCGKLYIGVKYTENWGDWYKPKPIFYWTKESFLAQHEVKEDSKSRSARWVEDFYQSEITTLFDVSPELQKYAMEVCIDLKCPIINIEWNKEERWDLHARGKMQVSGAYRTHLNPCLKDYEFYRCMDAPTAFQELSMFLGGVIAHVDTPEPQTNKNKIEAHGFDYKDSFRKGPTKEHR